MNTKEKRLLFIASLMFLLYFLPFMIFPMASEWVSSRYETIETNKNQVQRLRRLIGQKDNWQQEHKTIIARETAIEAALLKGGSYNLIGTQLQDILTTEAKTSKLQIRSLEVAEFSDLEYWLLVSQTLRFESNSQQLYDFILALQADPIQLSVVILNVQVGRKNKLDGSLTITGISHLINNEN